MQDLEKIFSAIKELLCHVCSRPARMTGHSWVFLNSLYYRNALMLLQGPRVHREPCLYAPQHRRRLRGPLELVSLPAPNLHAVQICSGVVYENSNQKLVPSWSWLPTLLGESPFLTLSCTTEQL